MRDYYDDISEASALTAELHHLRRRVERAIEHRTGFHGRIQAGDRVWSEILDDVVLLQQDLDLVLLQQELTA